jgi:transposase-like protein
MSRAKVTAEEKQEAVTRVVIGGERAADVARDMGLVAKTISGWASAERKRIRDLEPKARDAELDAATDRLKARATEVVDAEIVEEDDEWEAVPEDEAKGWEEIRAGMAEIAAGSIRTGRRLIRMKARIDIERPGDWENTVRRELHISPESASVYMRVARSEGIRELMQAAPHRLPSSLNACLVIAAMSRAEVRVALRKDDLGAGTTSTQAKAIRMAVTPPAEDEVTDDDEEEGEKEEEKPAGTPRLCRADLDYVLHKLEQAYQTDVAILPDEEYHKAAAQHGNYTEVVSKLGFYVAHFAGRLAYLQETEE